MNGKRTDKGGIILVEVGGTWEEMGCQYGSLLKKELMHVYDSMMRDQIEAKADLIKDWDYLSETIYRANPKNLKVFFEGMSRGSGIDKKTLAYINAVEYCVGVVACSGLALWGDYSSGGLVFGRNYDYNTAFKKINTDLVLTVFKPSDGSQPVMTIGYAGEIYAVNGLNRSGIFLELNNATPSGGVDLDMDRLFSPERLMSLLFEADSLEYVERYFRTVYSNQSYIIGLTDGKKAEAWEWDNVGLKPLPLKKDGLMAITNFYQNTEWAFAEPEDERCWSGKTRLNNMISLCEKAKGKIGGEEMKKIMETPISEGGPFIDADGVYQMVYLPEESRLWIKSIGNGRWTEFDTGNLLK